MITATNVGTETVGGSWFDLVGNVVYLQPVTIPANSLLSSIRAHIRHDINNVPSIAGYVFSDDAGAPDYLIGMEGQGSVSLLLTSTGRWMAFPINRWFASATDVWIGVMLVGSGSQDIAYETTGGSGGSLASLSDAATWTAGTRDYSMYAVALS